jgi:UDP-glucose:glycoprotein glucosyltransferase
VLTGRPVFESFSQGNVLDGIFDVSDREEGGDVIFWFNDLEKDGRYGGWPATIEAVSELFCPIDVET